MNADFVTFTIILNLFYSQRAIKSWFILSAKNGILMVFSIS